MLNGLVPDIDALRDTDIPEHVPAEGSTITVLTGAGASIHVGGPATNELTELVNQSELSSAILQVLREQSASPESVNFEDVLHVLEELESYLKDDNEIRSVSTLTAFLNYSGVLVGLDVNALALRAERFAMIEAIGQRARQLNYPAWQTFYSWLRPFLDRYDLRWFTLNYDIFSDVAMNVLSMRTGRKWYNGFGGILNRFNPKEYADPSQFGRIHLYLGHLHGSVGYVYAETDPRLAHRAAYELVGAQSIDQATGNWQWFHRMDLSGAIEPLGLAAPIISGLRKTEKLNGRPYGNYLHGFVQSLYESPLLLLVGYGGGDEHINYWIREFIDIHAGNARVIEVNRTADPSTCTVAKLGSRDLIPETLDESFTSRLAKR